MSETAAAAKRSLYEPVGLMNSSLNDKFAMPAAGPMRREGTSGVSPSPRVKRASGGTADWSWGHRQMDMVIAFQNRIREIDPA
jgi:hypothetical protein